MEQSKDLLGASMGDVEMAVIDGGLGFLVLRFSVRLGGLNRRFLGDLGFGSSMGSNGVGHRPS